MGHGSTTLAGNDGNHFFVTFPTAGSTKASRIRTAQVTLTWNNTTGAATYNVKRATTSGHFVVSAVNSSGAEGPSSTQVSSTPGTGPTTFIPLNASWKYLDNGSNQGTAWRATTFATGLVEGTNVIAIEIHQSSATSSDISFRLELVGNR